MSSGAVFKGDAPSMSLSRSMTFSIFVSPLSALSLQKHDRVYPEECNHISIYCLTDWAMRFQCSYEFFSFFAGYT